MNTQVGANTQVRSNDFYSEESVCVSRVSFLMPSKAASWCSCGAVATESMGIMDFIAIFTAIYGVYLDLSPYIYCIYTMDGRSMGLTQKRSLGS